MATVFFTRPLKDRLRASEQRKRRFNEDPEYRERRRKSNREAQARYRERHRKGVVG